jgi:hypothetical protein
MSRNEKNIYIMAVAVIGLMIAIPARAQEDNKASELIKKLANPVANLISVPLQYNYNENYRPNEEEHVHYATVDKLHNQDQNNARGAY